MAQPQLNIDNSRVLVFGSGPLPCGSKREIGARFDGFAKKQCEVEVGLGAAAVSVDIGWLKECSLTEEAI